MLLLFQSRAMRGYEIDLLSEEALADLNPFPVVFARVSPDNKLKIVRALQSKKYSVCGYEDQNTSSS